MCGEVRSCPQRSRASRCLAHPLATTIRSCRCCRVLLDAIPTVPTIKSASLLPLHCASARANYFIRVVLRPLVDNFLQSHDKELCQCYCTIMDVAATGCDSNPFARIELMKEPATTVFAKMRQALTGLHINYLRWDYGHLGNGWPGNAGSATGGAVHVRQVPLHPSDWKFLGCRVQEDGPVYINTVGTFGISSASY